MKTLTTREIREVIIDEINRREEKRYGKLNETPYFLCAFTHFNDLNNYNINDKVSFAKLLAASFDPMSTTEPDVRDKVDKLYDYYDDSDLLYWGNDD